MSLKEFIYDGSPSLPKLNNVVEETDDSISLYNCMPTEKMNTRKLSLITNQYFTRQWQQNYS